MTSENECPNTSRIWMLGTHQDQHRAVLFRPSCKRWSCPYCGEINRARWVVRAFQGVEILTESGHDVKFLTLTSHEALGPEKSLKVLPHCWSVLGQRARRKSERFEYLLIPERHEDGRVHIHALETGAFGNKWWKDNARSSGLGYMAKEKPIDNPSKAAWYVSKYLGKQLTAETWPKGYRHVRTSQGWPKLPEQEPPEGWIFTPLPANEALSTIFARLKAGGFDVVEMGGAAAWVYVNAVSNDGEIIERHGEELTDQLTISEQMCNNEGED